MDPTIRPRTSSHSGAGREPSAGHPLRVHVVEGDAAYGREVARALEAHGMIARVIGTGQEALDAAGTARPDLIVLCAELPDVSGYAVCSRLKRNRQTASIPIILTSARADTRSFRSHQRLWVHAEAYLRKPFDVEPLAALLARSARLVQRTAEDVAPAPAAPAIDPATAPSDARGDDRGGDPAPRGPAPEEILEDGFECVGGAEPEVLEEGFVYLGGGTEAETLEDGLVHMVEGRSDAPAPVSDEVLEDGFVYLGGGTEPAELDEAAVFLTGLETVVGGAARTAPGRWKLPEGLGTVA